MEQKYQGVKSPDTENRVPRVVIRSGCYMAKAWESIIHPQGRIITFMCCYCPFSHIMSR